jgi:hypothetical protein
VEVRRPETSVRHQPTLRNIPENDRIHYTFLQTFSRNKRITVSIPVLNHTCIEQHASLSNRLRNVDVILN